MKSYYEGGKLLVGNDNIAIVDKEGKLIDIQGKEVIADGGISAIVTYQGGSFGGKKGEREDAYFMSQMNVSQLGDLKKLPRSAQKEIITATLHATVDALQEKTQEKTKDNPDGTTLSAAICIGDEVYIASVGDSIAARYDGKTLSKPLVKYHDINNNNEKERIKTKHPNAIITSKGVVGIRGTLAVTRSIGDLSAEKNPSHIAGVIHTPEIRVINLKKDERILLASDGIEKKINMKPAFQMLQEDVAQGTDLKQATVNLMEKHGKDLKTLDDVSMMVIDPKEGQMFGICDGHGGHKSSYEVSKEFGPTFTNKLAQVYKEYLANRPQKVKEAEAIYKNTQRYIENIYTIYRELHPGAGNNTSAVISFMQQFDEPDITAEKDGIMKLQKVFDLVEKEVVRLMEAHGSKSLDDFVLFLNKKASSNHQSRLITLLYLDLKNKGHFISSYDNMETRWQLNDGKRSIHADLMKFSLFNKKEKTNPYEQARNLLNANKSKEAQTLKIK